MIKKIITSIFISIFMLFSISILSACCSPAKFDVNIVFKDVDSSLELKDYVKKVEYGDGFEIEFVIPEGYNYKDLSATFNGYNYEYDIEFADDTIPDEYKYAVSKKIKLHVRKIVDNAEIVFDMSTITKKQFNITLDNSILNFVSTEDVLNEYTNMQAYVIDENCIGNLRSFNSSYILKEKDFKSSSVSLTYNDYVVLCYNKPNERDELDSIYSEVDYFTDERFIQEINTKEYAYYPVSRYGNNYYNIIESNREVENSRLFYIGQIKKDVTLYKEIPNYDKEKGFILEDNENKFSLFTNRQDYNCESLSIEFFLPTSDTYSSLDKSMVKLDDVVIKKVDKYLSDGDTIKNPNLLYEKYRRYDIFNMYIGSDLDNDQLISDDDKECLPTEFYVRIGSYYGVQNMDLYLLSYEKQSIQDDLKVTSKAIIKDNYMYIKIDSELLQEQNLILDRRMEVSEGQYQDYCTGNAILYPKMRWNDVDIPYSRIAYPINDWEIKGYDSGYTVEIYYENEDSSIDYGFLDFQQSSEDIFYIDTDKLWINNGSSYTYIDRLYINIEGPKYNGSKSPTISNVIMTTRYGEYVGNLMSGFPVENAKEFNGLKGQKLNISGYNNTPTPSNQYTLKITLYLTEPTIIKNSVYFNELNFESLSQKLYISNSVNFDNIEDFKVLDANTKSVVKDVIFGLDQNIYICSTDNLINELKIYIGNYDKETGEYTCDKVDMISITEKLYDVLGNEVKVSINGYFCNVYVLSQTQLLYENIKNMCYIAYFD